MTCLGCSVGWDTWTGLKRLRYSLTIPVQLSAWINFPFQKNAAISRNVLWLSYLDPPLQLQQGSSLFIFFSKQHGECSWTESWCAPLSCAPLMSGAVGMVSESPSSGWLVCKDALWQTTTARWPAQKLQLQPSLLWEIVEFISILPNMIFCHFMYLNTSSAQNGVLPSNSN